MLKKIFMIMGISQINPRAGMVSKNYYMSNIIQLALRGLGFDM